MFVSSPTGDCPAGSPNTCKSGARVHVHDLGVGHAPPACARRSGRTRDVASAATRRRLEIGFAAIRGVAIAIGEAFHACWRLVVDGGLALATAARSSAGQTE